MTPGLLVLGDTLGDYEERLKNVGFIRIHKSFLVNFRFIEYVGKTTVTLTDGSTLSLSRNRVAETKRKLLIFSRNKVQICANNLVKNL